MYLKYIRLDHVKVTTQMEKQQDVITDQMWQKLSVRARGKDTSHFCGSGIWLNGVYQRTGEMRRKSLGRAINVTFALNPLSQRHLQRDGEPTTSNKVALSTYDYLQPKLKIQLLSYTSHISNAKQAHVSSGHCFGQYRYSSFPSSQKVPLVRVGCRATYGRTSKGLIVKTRDG